MGNLNTTTKGHPVATPNYPRIVLVQPSTRQGVQSLFTFHKNEGLGAKPPLGLLILATYLMANGFPNVHCLDAQLENLSPEETVARLQTLKPDIVGLTAWTDFWYPTWKTISLLRQALPACTIVLGGPHCLVFPEETLGHSEADYLVCGDGEDTLLDLVRHIQADRPVPDLPGLWRKPGGRVQAPASPCAVVEDVDKIPNPNRLLLPYRQYNSVLNPNDFETTMTTSRGCPHRCIFCKMHAQKVYARSVEQVVREFCEIEALGIKDIQVYDDTFTWSKQRVMQICEGILDHQLKVRWAIRDRVSRADAQMYALLKQAGCYRIHFGVESGSPAILRASGKGITLEQAERAVALAKNVGLTTLAYFMFGFLDETREDAVKTIKFAKKLNPDYAVFATLIPYPGTALYDLALERGIIPGDFWREFVKNPTPDYYLPHLIEQHLDRKTLIQLKDNALFKYYFTPAKMWKEFRLIKSWSEFHRKVMMGLNILIDKYRL